MQEVIQTEQFLTTLTLLTEQNSAAQLKELSSILYTDTYTDQYMYRELEHGTHADIHIFKC